VNKTELIEFLRYPSKLTSSNLDELEGVIRDAPYFLSARLLLAKGSKELGDKKTPKRIASAAIYSTDRILLKKYLSSNLFFLGQAVAEESATPSKTKKVASQPDSVEGVNRQEESEPRADKRPGNLKVEKKGLSTPQVPVGGLDALLDELEHDMKNLKASRHHFAEIQQNIEEEDAVAKAINENKLEIEKSPSYPPEKQSEEPKTVYFEEKPIKSKKEDEAETEFKIELNPKEEQIFSKKLEELSGEKKKKVKKPKEQEERKEKLVDQKNDKGVEKSINEPRFSRFSTRSYLKNLKTDFESDFDFFGKDEKKEDANTKAASSENKVKKIEEKEAFKKLTSKSREADKAPSSKSAKKKGGTKKDEPKKDDSKENDKSDREKQTNVIDKFIKESPSIKYTKKDEISTTDLAETSASWDRNLASEYLAEIYLKQGNKKRTKEIYKALMLKYPEKKPYFADLISKIE